MLIGDDYVGPSKVVKISKLSDPDTVNVKSRDITDQDLVMANIFVTTSVDKIILSCFIPECDPIRDDKLQIQLLLDNCSAHPKDLDFMDPDIAIKFLPANTTSVIQPMDQAVLCCVKSYQKKNF